MSRSLVEWEEQVSTLYGFLVCSVNGKIAPRSGSSTYLSTRCLRRKRSSLTKECTIRFKFENRHLALLTFPASRHRRACPVVPKPARSGYIDASLRAHLLGMAA